MCVEIGLRIDNGGRGCFEIDPITTVSTLPGTYHAARVHLWEKVSYFEVQHGVIVREMVELDKDLESSESNLRVCGLFIIRLGTIPTRRVDWRSLLERSIGKKQTIPLERLVLYHLTTSHAAECASGLLMSGVVGISGTPVQ